MRLYLAVVVSILALVGAALLQVDYDQLLRRLAFAKRRDKPVENMHLLLIVLPLLAVEVVSLFALGFSWHGYWPVVAFTAFVPLNFMFMCNIFLVGAHREAAWICGAVIAFLSSLLLFGEVRFVWVLSWCVVFTAAICFVARRDAYSHYRIGLRFLDEKKKAKSALPALQTAHQMAPEDVRYLYHLGRANLEAGDSVQGERMIDVALRKDPALGVTLKTDPLFCEAWIPPVVAARLPGAAAT